MLVTVAAVGCSGGGSKKSAPDAAACSAPRTMCDTLCVDTSVDPRHCGGCGVTCSPIQACEGTGCECPGLTVPNPLSFFIETMDTQMYAPLVLGIGAFTEPNTGALHALVIGFDPQDVVLDTPIALTAGSTPFVGVGYDVNVATGATRGTLRSTAGTLSLAQACAEGVQGTMADVVVAEVDATTEPPTVLGNGCSFALPGLTFQLGSNCP
jgi:hypothetical protein